MPVSRIIPVVLAVALGGCGSVGSVGTPQGQVAGGLPPPGDPTLVANAPPGGAVIAEPLPGTQGGVVVAGAEPVAVAAPPASTAVGRTDLLGGWTIAAGADSCQLFMTLTSWTGGYRASTRGCASEPLKSISAWNLEGTQVVLAGQGGSPIARLQSAGGSRFSGSTTSGGSVTFYR